MHGAGCNHATRHSLHSIIEWPLATHAHEPWWYRHKKGSMKLCTLSDNMLSQISTLLDQARPDQLVLDPTALAELRATLSGPGFVPKVYVGLEGGLIQGATSNCEMRLVGGDYNVDGSALSERRHLRAFNSTAITVEHLVTPKPEVCEALFADALGPENGVEDEPVEGMAQ